MSDSTAPPRRMPVRVARITFDDLFDGAYAGWWADLQVNLPLETLNGLAGNWEQRKAALSQLVHVWNFVDQSGETIDPKETDVWDKVIPTDLIRALTDRFNDEFTRLTDVPKASATPSAPTS